MPLPSPTPETAIQLRAFFWLLIAVSAAFAVILLPFSGAVMWAVFIAIIFRPVHQRMLRWLRRPNWATLATLALIVLTFLLPLALVSASLAQEIAQLTERLRSGELNPAATFQQLIHALPNPIQQQLDRLGLLDMAHLQERIAAALAASGQFLTGQLFSAGQQTLKFVASMGVMLYLLFFLLRDGRALTRRISEAVPLAPHHRQQLFVKFVTVVRATVKGNIVVALVQGMLGGLALWVLGLPAVLLLTVLMAVLSLLPAVGASLVWGPVALYLLSIGDIWQAVALVAWGVLVIGLVDNLLRPLLVGKDTQMPDYLVLISTLGGISVLGLNGFVIGPVIAALFLTVWDIFAEEHQDAPPASEQVAAQATAQADRAPSASSPPDA
jgi:predicted PurR-regulated permease PerM